MARLMEIMAGRTPQAPLPVSLTQSSHGAPLEPLGPGVVSQGEINAMATVMERLNLAMNQVSGEMLTESHSNPELREALATEANSDGVKVGVYQIQVRSDSDRMVNKQYYSVVNKLTGETLAHELSLYEAAHGLVRLLNGGNFVNSAPVRELLNAESVFTSQRIDAARFRHRMKKAREMGDDQKAHLYETRRQQAMDMAQSARDQVRKIYTHIL